MKGEPKLTLTEQIALVQDQKRNLQQRRVEAEKIIREYQGRFDAARALETRLAVKHIASPTDEKAVELDNARQEMERLTEEFEQAEKDIKNIPAGIKAAETEIRRLVVEKESAIVKIINSKVKNKVAALELKAQQAVAEYGASLVLTSSRNIQGSSIEGLMTHLTRDRTVLALMHETYAEMEKKLRFDLI